MRYFITFSCYGARIHGDESGSVDRAHRLFGGPVVELDVQRMATERGLMDQEPYALDAIRRACVLECICNECLYRGWILLAAHVRSSHVHLVVEASISPEHVLNVFKAYASRRLNLAGFDTKERKRWARPGSTRWLWTDEDVRRAIKYVVDEQGEAMAVFVGDRGRTCETAPLRSRLCSCVVDREFRDWSRVAWFDREWLG